jgi:twitching motility two-component system response regulator PilG
VDSAKTYQVGLCGLSVKDARLIEIVLGRAVQGGERRFAAIGARDAAQCDLAIVDANSPAGETELTALRAANPQIVPVFVSDTGAAGNSRYRIPRRMLLVQVGRVLELAAQEGLETSKIAQFGAPTPAAPGPTPHVAASPDSKLAPKPQAAATDSTQPLEALVVDDSEAVRNQMREALARVGIRATCVGNADEALTTTQVQGFDVILLDVVMPGIDGYELCRTLKKNPYMRSVPVLMLTSRSSPFDKARGALAGCDSYLVKPVTWTGFCEALDKVLMRRFRNDRALMSARGYRFGKV